MVARFQGGPNAVIHLSSKTEICAPFIPSGIFQGDKVNIIGNGVVLDPALFKAEAEALEASGITWKTGCIFLKSTSYPADTHRILDAAYEATRMRKGITEGIVLLIQIR